MHLLSLYFIYKIRWKFNIKNKLNIQLFQITYYKVLHTISKLTMKKIQNYLLKPEELRKKLENPKFRSDFIQSHKNNPSQFKDSQSRNHSRSRSPVQTYQKSLNLHKKSLSMSKQNIKPNSSISKGVSTKLKVTSKQKIPHGNTRKILSQKQLNRDCVNRSLDSKHFINTLTSKNRYNSCKSISMQQRTKQRSQSTFGHNKSKDQQKPNRLTLKYSYRTKQGVHITNPNKTNQDSLLIKTQLNHQNISVFAVADGHGTFGHFVSQHLVKNLSKNLQAQMKNNKSLVDCIPSTFNKLQQEITDSQINVACSGSTFVNVMIQNSEEIICANVGDSRAILARQIDRKNWEMIYLSQDHKPSVQSQKKRILKCGGKIHAFKDEKGLPIGPQRVWLPNQNMQGLAMSRSFGDNVSKPIGVTHIPQIIRLKIDKRDKFILLASDGVWEFISNQEVLQLLVPYYRDGKLQEACDALMRLAYERWTVQDKSIVDDITLILIFLSHQG